MAATGFTPISLYYSATASAVPLAANLTAGELALNTNDGKLYYKNSSGTVAQIAGPGAAGDFTNLTVTGNTTLGDASTDTVTVNGYMGVGGAATSTTGVKVSSAALTGVSQIGFQSVPVGTSSATTQVQGVGSQPGTAAAAFTCAATYAFRANNAVLGAGSTITNQHGVYVDDQTNGTNNYGIRSIVSSGTNKWNLYVSGTADNYFAGSVGIGTTSLNGINLRITKNITGGPSSYAIYNDGQIQSDVTSVAYGMRTGLSTAASAFTLANLRHYEAQQGTIGAGSTVTNQSGFFVDNSLTGATNNYGFFGNIASGTNRWNFYANGTADNYFAGKVGIGTNAPAVTLAISATDAMLVPTGTTAQRPTGAAGYIRYNSTTGSFEGYTTAWGSIGGGATGAGGDQIFYENGQTVNTSYTITASKNAGTFGPVTVASGVTVTVPSGSVWSVV